MIEGALKVLNESMTQCVKCALSQTRKLVVPGEGPEHAELVFIGEAPGFNEDQRGRPFIGQAGNLLNELLGSINMSRNDVFITNIVKCRPPNNRDPQPGEIEACQPWLSAQFEVLKPLVICTLGRHSMARYFKGTISRIHGQAQKIDGVWVMPHFHPAAALHQQALKPQLFEDFAKLPALLEQARSERENDQPKHTPATQQRDDGQDHKQLSLF